jgi:moderate conductance mechanosensitive channel
MSNFDLQFLLIVWWGRPLLIIVFFLLAYFIHRLAGRMANRFVHLNRFSGEKRQWRPERRETLKGLSASIITFLAFGAAALFSLSLYIDTETLVWMVGLFSAAFGLGARPLISDFLTGIGFIFEDTFDVGEKIELPTIGSGIEGVIERVNLRTTMVRAPTGELYTVPNGEIRLVRNFSRGRFSVADIKLKIAATDLQRALPILEELAIEAISLLPNLLEPWQVIYPDGEISQHTEIILTAKARFGQAAEMRRKLIPLVQERLEEAEIHLAG